MTASILALALLAADPHRHALVVGVPEYDSKALPLFTYAGADSYELARMLARVGYTVSVMNEGEGRKNPAARPTLANLRAALRAIAAGKAKRDQIVFAFVGHGMALDVGRRSYGYLCPRDADPSTPLGLLSLDDVFLELGKSEAVHKLMLFDLARPGAKVRPFDPGLLPKLPAGQSALFASSAGQAGVSSEDIGRGHGAFAWAIADGLAGKIRDEDGDLTWSELADYASKETPRIARAIDPRAKQTPRLVSSLAGPAPVLFRYKRPPRRIANSVGMEFAYVPPGRSLQGAPKEEKGNDGNERLRAVVLTRPCYLGIHEVTQKQYRRLMKDDPSAFSAKGKRAAEVRGLDTDDFPVESVSWEDAVAFCEVLSRLPDERKAGRAYRLPTEAEWEHACRAGTRTAFAFGDRLSSRQANFDGGKPYDAPKGPWLRRPCPVGSHKPNAWGLHDMHGNVREWTLDRYERDLPPGPLVDPTGPETGRQRVVRGGAWSFGGDDQRSARRRPGPPGHKSENLGFRVLLVAP
ncbi:MAG: SUMF1/EgtB/PvdO family nonheme iron enzyme [Gemmataceae bacterium]|nr:SUMF1/EgtB/PvdO family nonheme iron enzyme [Gemmataceae bacterium]